MKHPQHNNLDLALGLCMLATIVLALGIGLSIQGVVQLFVWGGWQAIRAARFMRSLCR